MKKKVLFYIDSFDKGGTEKATLDLINNLDKEKFDITLMSRFPGGKFVKQLNTNIIYKSSLPISEHASKLYDRIVRSICNRLPRKIVYRLLIHEKYDIEIACGDAFPSRIIGGSTNKKSKKISWIHMDITKDKTITSNYTYEEGQEYFNVFDHIVCVSNECKDRFQERFGLENKLSMIYNVVLIENIINKGNELTPKYPENYLNIISVGRLTWQKGYDRLLEVCKKLNDLNYLFKLRIIGTGEDLDSLQSYIQNNNLENCVELLGYKDNPHPYIKSSNLYICASRHESFSLVVAESLILETPILTTKCTGPNELLNYGEFGIIVDNSLEGIYKGLKTILDNPDILNVYREKQYLRKSIFYLNDVISKWEEIL